MPFRLVILLAVLLLATTTSAQANDISGRAEVISSNMLRIGQAKIVLWGIKAPEKGQVCTPFAGGRKIPCGNMAFQALKALVPDAPITCTPKSKTKTKKRLVAHCRYQQKDINKMMVEGGFARAIPGESMSYVRLERMAAEKRAGLWRLLIAAPGK
ncbi:thermonuclease family protein [Magnetospira sp. QH-2]|uniref:thermonuclease family protein n=1 Tax=Magnetospira sp. (strain QH-2) TaxID=1288970 RepID=UPI0003E80C1A|nr:thermonuclease family protein [Magnetospira sp. QH-2]CCQ75172.1 putative staphylococcal nuclease-like protein [Magnetospira sp. QH-2]